MCITLLRISTRITIVPEIHGNILNKTELNISKCLMELQSLQKINTPVMRKINIMLNK